MALKWQSIVGLTGGGSVGVLLLVALILNMSGMTFVIPSDQVCTDCYDIIQVNSTVWEIKVEHAGPDKDLVFAKRMRSRTRWVNLDKVDSLVETNPQVFVEILVPTVKRYSTIKHPEYGYLRPLKEGDSLIRRKSEKYNPKGSRFVVHGLTGGQTVKWGFNLDSLVMDGIVFDPVWSAEPKGFTFDILQDCKNEIRTRRVNKTKTVDCSLNVSCSDYNVTYLESEEYFVEICKEIGVKYNGKEVSYNQPDKKFLRTNSTLCAWLNNDGGANLESRGEEYRDVCRSGESCSCVNISNSFSVIKSRSDFKEVKI